MLFAVFYFLLLVKDAKAVKFYCFFFLSYYVTTVEAFPRFKINKVVEERLNNHQAAAFWTLHTYPFLFCPPTGGEVDSRKE
jgi:hypothetical protein